MRRCWHFQALKVRSDERILPNDSNGGTGWKKNKLILYFYPGLDLAFYKKTFSIVCFTLILKCSHTNQSFFRFLAHEIFFKLIFKNLSFYSTGSHLGFAGAGPGRA
jgi:hypothetical protein